MSDSEIIQRLLRSPEAKWTARDKDGWFCCAICGVRQIDIGITGHTEDCAWRDDDA